MSKAYILGALHDATEREYTYRLSQKEKKYVEFIADMLEEMDHKAWVYEEGEMRDLYVVEFAKAVLDGENVKTLDEKIDYIRGYFDTEGSIPKKGKTRFYIYFAQKDKKDLKQVKKYLEEIGVHCGKIHNPTKKDRSYWRFYVSSQSHRDFVKKVGSWHPRKCQLLRGMI